MTRPRFLLALGLCSTFAPRPARAAPQLELVERKGGVIAVRIQTDDGVDRLLERFKQPQAVFDSALSPDGRFALIWHHVRGPRRLTIYDVRTGKRTASFKPGFGGDLGFTPNGNILHTWGCGSNCHSFALYSPKGKRIIGDTISGYEILPSRSFFVTCPSLLGAEEPLRVFDLRSGTRVFESRKQMNNRFVCGATTLDEGGSFRIELDDSTGKTRMLVLEPGPSGKLVPSFPDGLPE